MGWFVLVVAATAGIGGYWYLHQATDRATPQHSPADEEPIVSVQTTPVRRERIEEN